MKQVRELSGCRKHSKLSQEAVAEKLGISRQTLSRWERGETEIPAHYLPKLAKIYGVTINDLLDELHGVTDTANTDAPMELPKKEITEQPDAVFTATVHRPSRRYKIALCSMATMIVLLAGLLILVCTDRNKQQIDSEPDVYVTQDEMDLRPVNTEAGSEFDMVWPNE